MTPEIESLAQQLIEAADGAQKAADDDWNWRYEGTIIYPDKRAYIHPASPENITAVILAFREELKQARRDALEEACRVNCIGCYVGLPVNECGCHVEDEGYIKCCQSLGIRALMEKPE